MTVLKRPPLKLDHRGIRGRWVAGLVGLVLVLALTVATGGAALAAGNAGTAAPSVAESDIEVKLVHAMAGYTNLVMVGAVAGAVVGNLAVGGVVPTAVAALLGGSAASLWFLQEIVEDFKTRRRGGPEGRPNK